MDWYGVLCGVFMVVLMAGGIFLVVDATRRLMAVRDRTIHKLG